MVPFIGEFAKNAPLLFDVVEVYIYEGLEYASNSIKNYITNKSNEDNVRQTQEDIISGVVPKMINEAIKAFFK